MQLAQNNMNLKQKTFVLLINLISRSWRIKLIGDMPEHNKGVLAFWHGSMLPVWKLFSNKNCSAVVSLSKDGAVLSELLCQWGYNLLRGSSSTAKENDLLSKMTDSAAKSFLLITPDGPRGPMHEFKAGAAVAAFRANVPLYLAAVRFTKFKQFNKSWDKFIFPFPFSRIYIYISQAYLLNDCIDRESMQKRINEFEHELNNMTAGE